MDLAARVKNLLQFASLRFRGKDLAQRRFTHRGSDQRPTLFFLKIAQKVLFPMISIDNDLLFDIAVDLDAGQKVALQPQDLFSIFTLYPLDFQIAAVKANMASGTASVRPNRDKLRELHLFLRLVQIFTSFDLLPTAVQKMNQNKAVDNHLFAGHLLVIFNHPDVLAEDIIDRTFFLQLQILLQLKCIGFAQGDIGDLDFFTLHLDFFAVEPLKNLDSAVGILPGIDRK